MSEKDEICKVCLNNPDGKKKCTHKSMKQKGELQVCENFLFVFAANVPYEIIHKLLQNDDFYSEFSEMLSFIITVMLNKSLFKLKINLKDKKIHLYSVMKSFDYGEFDFSKITLADNYCSVSIDNLFKSVLTTSLDVDKSILLIEFEDYNEKSIYHLAETYSFKDKSIFDFKNKDSNTLIIKYNTLNMDEAFVELEEGQTQ